MGILDWLKGTSKKEEIMEFKSKKAKIIDVRSPQEFQSGHAKNSINIPLGNIQSRINEIKKLNLPIILVCQSGNRASMAANILNQEGVKTINAGNWSNAN